MKLGVSPEASRGTLCPANPCVCVWCGMPVVVNDRCYSAGHSSCDAETFTQSANCAEDGRGPTGAVLGQG